ncbi:MAG: hypothetical protein EZS28_030822, partial [Streblomastix strix]
IGIITRIWKGGIYESLDKVKQWRFDDAEGPTAGKEDEITHSTLDYFGRPIIDCNLFKQIQNGCYFIRK